MYQSPLILNFFASSIISTSLYFSSKFTSLTSPNSLCSSVGISALSIIFKASLVAFMISKVRGLHLISSAAAKSSKSNSKPVSLFLTFTISTPLSPYQAPNQRGFLRRIVIMLLLQVLRVYLPHK